MAKRLGEYSILKRHRQIKVENEIVIGETVGYKLAGSVDRSNFIGAKLELDRNWEYSLEGSNPAYLYLRSLDGECKVRVEHNNWKEIKLADLCIRNNLVFILIVHANRLNTLSLYILTLDGELVTENRTEFGSKSASLRLSKAQFIIETKSKAVNLLIEFSSFRQDSLKYRVYAKPGLSLITTEERTWYECKFKGKPTNSSESSYNATGEAVLREDQLFYLQKESKVPRIFYLYNFKSQTSSEVILQPPVGVQRSEESDYNLISSTYCIDYKRNKILVLNTKLEKFFNHHLLLRIFRMSGLMEREILIWECEKCPALGLPEEYPVQSIATWSWPMEPISSTLTEEGGLWVIWFSGPNNSGNVFATLSQLNY